MPLQRFKYRVLLDGTDEPLDVEVTHGDLLRAELEADRQNLPVDPRKAPQQTTTLWVWAALVRTKVIDLPYRTFRDGDADTPPALVGFEQLRDSTGEPAAVDVPPTSPEDTSGHSLSPDTSED
jgi:hypothetical protein